MPYGYAPQNQAVRNNASGSSYDDLGGALARANSTLTQSANITVDPLGSALAVANNVKGAVTKLDPLGNSLSNALSTSIGDPLGSALASANATPLPTGSNNKNILSKYASYNCVFTLGVLTNDEINHPDATYRKYGPSILILRTGGTGNDQPRTLVEQSAGITGEYFIDDIEIDTIIAPNPKTKQTNATNISFRVVEPYSMGLFLQTLMLAALQGGHKNYLEAPYLLQVEFIGWDDDGNPLNIPKSKRMFPLKFGNVEFNVTQGGSEYSVTAIPWQEQAFSDSAQSIKNDIDIKGATLVELLQTGPESLATVLNNRELSQKNAGNKKVGDQHIIIFPTDRNAANQALTGARENNAGATTQSSRPDDISQQRNLSATEKQRLYEALGGVQGGNIPADFDAELSKILGIVVRRSKIGESIREWAEKSENVNAIGKSNIAKSFLDSGKPAFGKPAFTVDKKKPGVFQRGNLTISDNGRRINFKSGARVQNIIEELILLSDYGRKFASAQPDTNGFKDWFKIEANVYNVSDPGQVAQTGQTAKVFVYKVIPYKVHVSRLSSPTQASPSIPNLKAQAKREYNYIYTGKNDDVINFDIAINSAFFTAIQGDFGQLGKDSKLQGADKRVAPSQSSVSGAADGNTQVAGAMSKTQQANSSSTGRSGSGTQVHPETQVARSFNDAIVNSPTDLVSANVEIWGDPYYIADSGMGNYDATEADFNTTSDGTMNYQNGEVDIIFNFRTPVDYGPDGIMKFPEAGTKPVGAFSGLYQVTTVKNKFSGNKFTQELTTIRRRNQEVANGVDIGIEAVVEKGLDAIISPLAAAPASAISGALDNLKKSLNGVGGILSAGLSLDALGASLSNALTSAIVPPNLANAVRGLDSSLNAAKTQLTTAASSASDALAASLRGRI